MCYEANDVAKQFLGDNFPEAEIKHDVRVRRVQGMPPSTVVTAGFPCQPFSMLGLGLGAEDVDGRGMLVMETVKAILHLRPRVFLFENVAAFAGPAHRELHDMVLSLLSADGDYELHEHIRCSSTTGVPQTRRRWYLVGLLHASLRVDFKWPESIEAIPLIAVLGPRAPGDRPDRLPPRSQRNARANVTRSLRAIRARGDDPSSEELVVDVDASRRWCGKPVRFSPCLTRSRGSGLWLLARGCRISADACCRLQGIQATSIVKPARDLDMRRLMGNSMTLSAVEPLLRAALVSTGCIPPSTQDRWASGVAQALLVSEACGTNLPPSLVAVLPQRLLRHLVGDLLVSRGPRNDGGAVGEVRATFAGDCALPTRTLDGDDPGDTSACWVSRAFSGIGRLADLHVSVAGGPKEEEQCFGPTAISRRLASSGLFRSP